MKNQNNVDFIRNSKTNEFMRNRIKKRQIIAEVFNDYCSSTSIHGIGYLGAENKSLPEKIWWIIVFILSVLACSYLITKTYIKWKDNPVILSFEKEQIPIYDIPFPAVTVCPVNKVTQQFYNYTEMFRNRNSLTEEQYKEFWDISLVCNLEQFSQEFNCSINKTDEAAITTILKYAPSRYPISNEKWQNSPWGTSRIFAKQITEEGLCFTFNSLSQEDMFTEEISNSSTAKIMHDIKNEVWSIEDGYRSVINKDDYPRRTAQNGIAFGLSFMIGTELKDIDYVCGMPITGYKILVHSPAEVPKAAQHYFLVPANRKANIIIKPELTKTSKSLLSMPAHTRKCYFSHEKSLRFFKVYTQNNCRTECDANITLEYCDCVPFYMPRENSTSICGFASNECVKEVEYIMLEIHMKEKGSRMTQEDRKNIEYTRAIFDKCDCLPSCNSLEFSAEISYSEYHFVKTLIASGLLDEELSKEYLDELEKGALLISQIDIFFKESQFYALQRSEIYGRVDFLANIGGLLGLFMGFSILSLLEIIYFLTIRIWFKFKNRNNYTT